MSQNITVWVTRDGKNGDEPDLLFMHGRKPEIKDGNWTSEAPCMVVPDVKPGRCKKIRLEVE